MSTSAETEQDEVKLTLSKIHRRTLEKAAQVRGLTLNDYLLEIALNAATESALETESIFLSERDWNIVTSALENPPELNSNLQAAIWRYKKESQKG